jgi:hypothetical protein
MRTLVVLCILASVPARAGTIVVMEDNADLGAALEVALANRPVEVVLVSAPSGQLRLDRAASAQRAALEASADAAVWIDFEGLETIEVCALSADGQHFRHAPITEVSPRIFAAVATSLLDELVAPPELDVHVNVKITSTVTRAPARANTQRWISFGGVLVADARANLGARLEIDALARGGWTFGGIAQKAQDTLYVDRGTGLLQGQIDDWSLGIYVARSFRYAGWELRGSAGVLAMWSAPTDSDFADPRPFESETAMSPATELALSLSRDLGTHWGLSVALLQEFLTQRWTGDAMLMRDNSPMFFVASLRLKM